MNFNDFINFGIYFGIFIVIFLVLYINLKPTRKNKKNKKSKNILIPTKIVESNNMETLKNNSFFFYIFIRNVFGLIMNNTEKELKLVNSSLKDIFNKNGVTNIITAMIIASENPKIWNILNSFYFVKAQFYIYCYYKYIKGLISNDISVKEYLREEESRFNNENYWLEEKEKYGNERILSTFDPTKPNIRDKEFLDYFYKTLLFTIFEKMSDYLGYNMFDKFNLRNVDKIKLGELMVTFNKYPNLNKPNLWETAISYNLPTIVAFWVTFELFGRIASTMKEGERIENVLSRSHEKIIKLILLFQLNYFEHYDENREYSIETFNNVKTWNLLQENGDIFFEL